MAGENDLMSKGNFLDFFSVIFRIYPLRRKRLRHIDEFEALRNEKLTSLGRRILPMLLEQVFKVVHKLGKVDCVSKFRSDARSFPAKTNTEIYTFVQ